MFRKLRKLYKHVKLLQYYEDKLALYGKEIHYNLPEIRYIDKTGERIIREFKKKYKNIEDINTTISKNDFMFKYLLYQSKGGVNKALYNYLLTGYESLQIIEKLLAHKLFNLTYVNSFLDFASGYGRLTRFLVNKMPPEKIYITDIKKDAVSFQKKQFGVNGFETSFVPEEFKPNKSFDFIFASSFFSHLPHGTFERWLKILYDLLSEKGLLVITVHDISLINNWSISDYSYRLSSEDTMFREMDEVIEDEDNYGTMYVKEKYIQKVIKSIGINNNQYFRYPKASRGIQDIYVITKDVTDFDDTLIFS